MTSNPAPVVVVLGSKSIPVARQIVNVIPGKEKLERDSQGMEPHFQQSDRI